MSHLDQLKKEIRARDKVLLKEAVEKKQFVTALHLITSRSKVIKKRLEHLCVYGQVIHNSEEDLKIAMWAIRYLRRLTKGKETR